MNNLSQYFSELVSLTSVEQKKYLDRNVTDESIRQALESMLTKQALDFTALFSNGMSLSDDLVSGNNLLGQSIGKYEIISLIGQGGMGCVYLANRADGEFEQQVAIKHIPKELFQQATEQSFNHEAQSLANLNHPNIVSLYDSGKDRFGNIYIVMAYIEGASLDHYLQTTKLTKTKKIELFIKILEAIEHAHANQILHKDIKPQNVLVDKVGEPYLVDFGISLILNASDNLELFNNKNGFSAGYSSPEQVALNRLTTATDIYSAGKLLSYIFRMTNTDNSSDNEKLSELNEPFNAIVEKATHVNINKRYNSIVTFKSEIINYLGDMPLLAYNSKNYNLKIWIKRNKSIILISIIFLFLFVFSAGTYHNKSLETQKHELLAEKNITLIESLLTTVDVNHSSEFQQQKSFIQRAKKIDVGTLNTTQQVRVIKALANAYRNIADFEGYQEYADKLSKLTKNQPNFNKTYAIATKMQIELDIIYLRIPDANAKLELLFQQIELLSYDEKSQSYELLDWLHGIIRSSNGTKILDIYLSLKNFINPEKLKIKDYVNYRLFESHNLLKLGNIKKAYVSFNQLSSYTLDNKESLSVHHYITIVLDYYEFLYDSGYFSKMLDEKNILLDSIDSIYNALDRNHPLSVIVMMDAISLNRLSINTEGFGSIDVDSWLKLPAFYRTKILDVSDMYFVKISLKQRYKLLSEIAQNTSVEYLRNVHREYGYFLSMFSKYDEMTSVFLKLIKYSEQHNDYSFSMYYHSYFCYRGASYVQSKLVDASCIKGVQQSIELYGHNNPWTNYAKIGHFIHSFYKQSPDLREIYNNVSGLEFEDDVSKRDFYFYSSLYQLQKGELEKAKEHFDIALVNTDFKEPILKIMFLVLENKILLANNEKVKVIKNISQMDNQICDALPYENLWMVQLRKISQELAVNEINPCPNALRWEDVVTE